MTDRRQEDWISAYLDDELSPEELEQAQLWLENDAELRDYLEKLKGVGERIRTLPAHRLPSAFAAQIREKVGAMDSDENLDSKGRLAHAKTPVSLARQDDRSGVGSSSRGKYLALGLTGTPCGNPPCCRGFAVSTCPKIRSVSCRVIFFSSR